MFKIIIFFLTITLFANEYHLEDIASNFKIKKNILLKLKKNNIQTTIQFLLINKNHKMRVKNSKEYKLSLEKLEELTSLCSLMRIKGIGPNTAFLLLKSNVKSLSQLKNSDLKKLEKKLLEVNKRLKISPFTPNYKNLLGWHKQISKLNIILE